MIPIVALSKLVVVIILSVGIVTVMISTGLHRTVLCGVAGMAIVILVWSAYPAAQQLPHVFGFLYWILISLAIYHFPALMDLTPSTDSPSTDDDDLLDRFFKEGNIK